MDIATQLAQAGSRWDERTGAVTMPIYQTATFRHPGLGLSTGYDYTRSGNPTREVLEKLVAGLDGGVAGFAYASGMSAVDSVFMLIPQGATILATEDLYGGTFRLFEKCFANNLAFRYVDTTDLAAVTAAFEREPIAAVFIESCTNPLLKLTPLAAISKIAHAHGALVIIDNTFLTPVITKPIDHGADFVVYSATKYLAGHNDTLGGLAIVKSPEHAERMKFYQNAIGSVLGPFDCWLILRGLKTLEIRVRKQEDNARAIALFLAGHRSVMKVHYPDTGGMVSFEVNDAPMVPKILAQVIIFLFAESLGGVESLITYPAVQTHADIDKADRDRLGISDRLIRLSIGIESVNDLIADLNQALDFASV